MLCRYSAKRYKRFNRKRHLKTRRIRREKYKLRIDKRMENALATTLHIVYGG
jgi:hypothetical protein